MHFDAELSSSFFVRAKHKATSGSNGISFPKIIFTIDKCVKMWYYMKKVEKVWKCWQRKDRIKLKNY